MQYNLPYLAGYPQEIIDAVATRIQDQSLGAYLRRKYPKPNSLRSDTQLIEFVQGLKDRFMKKAPPLHKITWDAKMRDLRGALGLNTLSQKMQGRKIKSSYEIRIAALFKNAPAELLNMICVHELAHLKERDHNKAFYQLCMHMEPNYAILELDTRIYMTYMEHFSESLYPNP